MASKCCVLSKGRAVPKIAHITMERNARVEREVLLAMGYSKMVFKKEEQEAAAAGLMSKPLTQPGVEKALKDFGLDAESVSHQEPIFKRGCA